MTIEEANAELEKNAAPQMTIEEANAQLEQGAPTQTIEEANAQLEQGAPTQTIEEANAELERNAAPTQTIEEANAELEKGGKTELGFVDQTKLVFKTLADMKEAEDGAVQTGLRKAIRAIPLVGDYTIKSDEKRQEHVEQRLFEGSVEHPLEMIQLAQSIGIDQGLIEELAKKDADTLREGLKAAVTERLATRIKTREEKKRQVDEDKKNLNWLGSAAVGLLGGLNEWPKMATKPLAAATLPLDVINRGAELVKHQYTVDENGNPVQLTDGDSDARATLKALGGAGLERFIWMGAGKVMGKVGAKILEKSPALDGVLGKVAGKPLAWSAEVAKKLSESEGGRWLLKTGEILGKVNDTVHVGSLPSMMLKSRLTELADEVVGLNVPDEMEREKFMDWAKKFVSLDDNLELLTSVIGLHVMMGGYSALRARSANRNFRTNAREVLKDYLTDEQMDSMSNQDLQGLCRFVQSPGLTAERAGKWIDDIRAEQEEARQKVEAGETLTGVREGLETLKNRSENMVDASEQIAEKLKGDEQKAAEKAEQERLAKIRAAEMAERQAQAEKDAARDELSRIRGAEPAEQLAALVERGVTSWEDAEQKKLIGRDERGRWSGGAKQAINIHLNGTEKMKAAVKDHRMSGDLAEQLLTLSYCELGNRPKAERDALIDRIIDESDGNPEAAMEMMRELTGSQAVMTKVPETALEGAVNAERMKGTELHSVDGAMLGCTRFGDVKVVVSQDGILTEGLTDALMSNPKNQADVAALLVRLNAISEKTGLAINFGADENAAKVANDVLDAIEREGLEKIQRKMDTRARLFEILSKTALDTGTTWSEAEFKKALAETPTGRRFLDNHGNVYGFKDAEGRLHFNPAAINYNTPIHEYGHLALEAVKKINPTLWKRGMELIRKSGYFEDIRKASETEGDGYSYLKGDEEGIRDEALVTLIGDRGEKLVEAKGLGAELKAWLKEFWKAFKGAFGVADLTDEQIEKMSVGDFVDAINAELLRGKEFGTKKMQPLEQSGMNVPEYIKSRIEEGDPDFDLDWETARELEHDLAEGVFQITSDKTKDAKASRSLLSDTAASAEVSALIRRSVAPVQDSLTSMQSIPNAPESVKGAIRGIASVVESIATGRRVKGMQHPTTVKNLITTLSVAGFNRSAEGGDSAYLMLPDRSIRISDHSADAWRFKRENNLSVKLSRSRSNKPFNADDQHNVIEVTYGRQYLERNPQALAGMLRDMAEFAATGTFHDTVGAAKIEVSGDKTYREAARQTLAEDATKRGDNTVKMQIAGPGAPRFNRRNFIAGRAMVAEDYGRGERTPGAMAASRELDQQRATPISAFGTLRRLSLPLSELEALRRMLTGDAAPAHIVRAARAGETGGSYNRAGKLFLNADILGMVDKTDVAPEKDQLKLRGFFMNEDPAWCATHSAVEITHEKNRSEDQLADALNRLANRRAAGSEPGGFAAARQVFADQVAAIIVDMPQNLGGVLGRVQKIGKGLRTEIKNNLVAQGTRASDAEAAMRGEAGAFLDWAYGGPLVDPATGATASRGDVLRLQDLTGKMFGAWLVMPEEMSHRAPEWTRAIESTIANNAQLADAFRELTTRSMSEQASSALEMRIRNQQKIETEKAIRKLQSEARAPIGTGSRISDAKETFLVAFHDKFAPVYIRLDEQLETFLKAKHAALKAARTPAAKAAVLQQIELYKSDLNSRLHRLELSRTAYERGAWNEGRIYFMRMVKLENEASKRWGLSEEDRSLYLDYQRIIETQGRSGSDGISPRQAAIRLGDMARRLGAVKWRNLQKYGDEFFKIHEQEVLDDPRVEKALGKAFVDYCRTQTHYVATKRTWSPEELDAIESARTAARRAGVAGGDDVVSAMYQFAGSRGAGSVVGEGVWLGRLNGSMSAKQEVRSATWEKVDPLMQFARRNQMILDLKDALLASDVPGVRDMKRTEGSAYPSEKNGRYGHISYMENGEKRVLIVPRQIADAFKIDPDNAKFLTKANGLIRKMLIDWNLAYTPMNIRRNQDSLEKNMPGMREPYLKTALRATVPGATPLVDLFAQALVRNVPVAGNLFGKHTVLFHLPKAERYAKIVEDPSAWQQELWKAEDAHDVAKVARLWDDFDGVMHMLKGNFLVPTGKAYDNGGKTNGFAFDALDRKGLKTLDMIDRERSQQTRLGKFWSACNIFKKNAAQNEHEDILAKTAAYLHDRMFYDTVRGERESGLMAKRNVSIAEGERSGTLKRGIQASVAQFFNMVEKGVVRHWRNFGDRPTEMLVRDGKVWMGRALGSIVAYGVLQKWLLASADDDEEKAKEKYGKLYDYADAYHRAWQNCSDYVRENYNFVPVWTSPDGMTSLVMGGALTDEDKLITPSADFFAKWIAFKAGVGERPDLGATIAKSSFKAVTPDMQMAGPVMNILRDTVEAAFLDNPTDFFRGAPTYDPDLWESRNESWEMRGKFAAAVGARLWSDIGGRGIIAPDVNGVDNGRGDTPSSLNLVLKRIPIVSPVIGRMFKVQVGSTAKRGEPITDEQKRKASIIRICAKDLLKEWDGEQGLEDRDMDAFNKKIEKWSETYNFTDYDRAKLMEEYYNAAIQRSCIESYDEKQRQRLMKEAAKQGRDELDVYLMLGEL